MNYEPSRRRRPYRQERNFGLLVGGVFLALGCWWLFRNKFTHLAPVFVTGGALLVTLGALLPRLLVWPNRAWMAMAEAMSFVMTHVIMGIVFFAIVAPIGVLKRWTGWDPLRRRAAPAPTYWQAYPDRQRDPKHYEKMY